MKHVIATLAVVLGFGVAHAQDNAAGGSEFFHQAGAGVSEVTPHLNYRSETYKFPNGGGEATRKGIDDLGARYEYGVNEMISVYGDLSISMVENKVGTVSSNPSGLNDIELGFRGTSAMGMGNLRYGLGLTWGIEKAKTDANGLPSNNSTGGMGLTPYVGWDMAVGPGMWGAVLSYNYLLERTTEATGGGESKEKDGHILGIGTFYEYLMADMTFGGRLMYAAPADTKTTSGGSETTAGTSPMITVGAYTAIPAGPGALLAGLDYGWLSGKKYQSTQDNLDSSTIFNINVGYRIAF